MTVGDVLIIGFMLGACWAAWPDLLEGLRRLGALLWGLPHARWVIRR